MLDCTTLSGFSEFVFEAHKRSLEGICDVYAVVHAKSKSNDAPNKNIIYLGDEQIFKEIDHSKDVSMGLIPGNPDLKILRALKELPSYERIIRVESGVACTGNRRDAFERLIEATTGVDLAESYISPWMSNGWVWWDTLIVPKAVQATPRSIVMKAFLPLFIALRKFLEVYEEALREGWGGHYEITMATVAKYNNLTLLDLSEHEECFTHYPQFTIRSVEQLEKFIPKLVRPVKNVFDLDLVYQQIRLVDPCSGSSPPVSLSGCFGRNRSGNEVAGQLSC